VTNVFCILAVQSFDFIYNLSMVSPTLLLFNRTHDSAKPDDLFAALQEAADAEEKFQDPDLNVKSIMESWTRQAGYPLITASRTTNGDIHITQVGQMQNTAAFTKGTYNYYN
jgi:aminopeptidase N